jgi:hypothetical protein
LGRVDGVTGEELIESADDTGRSFQQAFTGRVVACPAQQGPDRLFRFGA